MAKRSAKTLNEEQLQLVLGDLQRHRYPTRDRVLILLSFKAGLRAQEIAKITWRMVMTSDMQIDRQIVLENTIAKKGSGRLIPMNSELRAALMALWDWYQEGMRVIGWNDPIIMSERAMREHGVYEPMRPGSIVKFFDRLYARHGLSGCSSHSGRRTFGTRAARRISAAGGSLRDVQDLLGHKDIRQTQTYIDVDEQAKQRVIDLI